MRSIITKDVPDYAVVMGGLAKVSRMRLDTKMIEAIEKSRWWEMTPDQLMEFYPYIQYPAECAKKIIECREKTGWDLMEAIGCRKKRLAIKVPAHIIL